MQKYLTKHIEQIVDEKAFTQIDDPQMLLKTLETLLYQRATQNTVTVDVKTHRILKVSQEDGILLMNAIEQSPELQRRFQSEGVLYKQEITTKQHLPDTELAKWIYELVRKNQKIG